MKFCLSLLILGFVSLVLCGPGLNNKLRHALTTRSKQYYISQSPDNFYQAYLFCRAQDMQLLTITAVNQTDEVESVLEGRDLGETTNIWTSGNRLGSEVNFLWMSTGKFVVYSDWNDGEPNNSGGDEECVELTRLNGTEELPRYYKWNDKACANQRHFICEINLSEC